MPAPLAIPIAIKGGELLIAGGVAATGAFLTWWYGAGGKEQTEQAANALANSISNSMSGADEQAETKLESGSVAATCAAGNCPPPECKNLVENMDHKNRKLKKELNKYDPVSDAQGGHTYMGADGLLKVTKPGGHYKEIRYIQRGLKNDLEQYNKRKCYNSQGPADKATREAA
jgi:hypothetical protein